MRLFSKKDPILKQAEQRDQQFAYFKQQFGFDEELLNLAKAQWLTSRGNHHGQRKQYLFAMVDFGEALDFKPDYLSAHFGIVLTYIRTGMLEKARETLEAAPDETKDSKGNVLGRKSDIMEKVSEEIDLVKVLYPDNQ